MLVPVNRLVTLPYLLLAGVFANADVMPSCGTSCIYQSTEADVACGPTDLTCLCGSAVFIDAVASCLPVTCVDPAAINATVTNAAGLCEAVTGEDILDDLTAAIALYQISEAAVISSTTATAAITSNSSSNSSRQGYYEDTRNATISAMSRSSLNGSAATSAVAAASDTLPFDNVTTTSIRQVSTSGSDSPLKIGASMLIGATSGAVALLVFL